jgi:hypothetical protein
MVDRMMKSSLIVGSLLLLWWLAESWWMVGTLLALQIAIVLLSHYSLKRYKQRYTYAEDDWRSLRQVADQQPVGSEVVYGNVLRPDRVAFVKHVRWLFPYLLVTVWDIDVEENASGSRTVIERFYAIDRRYPFIHTEMLGGFLVDAEDNVVTMPERQKSNVMNRKARKTVSLIPNSEEVADLASWFKDAEILPS